MSKSVVLRLVVEGMPSWSTNIPTHARAHTHKYARSHTHISCSKEEKTLTNSTTELEYNQVLPEGLLRVCRTRKPAEVLSYKELSEVWGDEGENKCARRK